MSVAVLLLVASLIGASVGLTGMGGFLLVPLMALVASMTTAQSVATALLANLGAMAFAGLVHARRRLYSLTLLLWLCLGTVIAALVTWPWIPRVPDGIARVVARLLLVGLGLSLLLGLGRLGPPNRSLKVPAPVIVLVGVVAYVAALTAGIGGPAITVPLLARTQPRFKELVGAALLHGLLVSTLGLALLQFGHSTLNLTSACVALDVAGVAMITAGLRPSTLPTSISHALVGFLALMGGGYFLVR